MPKLALIRGFGDEPLCRAVSSLGKGVVFVSSLRSKDAINQWFPPPIGVPLDDIFAYDEQIFERLQKRWKGSEKIGPTEWGKPFDPSQ